MPYENIPGVLATYLDGSLTIPSASGQPRILIVGFADAGDSYRPFSVGSVGEAEAEFGATSELLQGTHEAVAQGASNIRVMRIGGRRGTLTITDSDTDTLVIRPYLRDDEAMERFALVIDGSGDHNRILVFDVEENDWVYDSDEIFVINDDQFQVTDNGLGLFSVGDITDPTTYVAFTDLVTGDFSVEGTETMTSVVAVDGEDGSAASLCERYAALSAGYHALDFRDLDIVIPMNAFLDAPNVVDGDSPNFFKGAPVAGTATDALGYVWEYFYQGQKYTYFTDASNYHATKASAVAASKTLVTNSALVLTAQKTGTGGNLISIQISAAGASGPTVTISEPTAGSLKIMVVDDGTATTTAVRTAINAALAAYTTTTGVLASTLVVASGTSATVIATEAETFLASGTGSHFLSHEQLTGDPVPAAVATRWTAAVDAEMRECNFVHQQAAFCYEASTQWKAVIGVNSVDAPPAVDRISIASWVGSLPTYTTVGEVQAVETSGDNGSGLLGIKFLAGRNGYREGMVPDGDSNDGFKGGGFILTKGTSLPNGDDNPYGILDSDEATDAKGEPIDIGKHIILVTDWPVHRNAFNGGVAYRGATHSLYAGILSKMPENIEPIGTNGLVTKVNSLPRIHASQLDALSQVRMNAMRQDDVNGLLFINANTAAHPDSDYTKVSTIRCVNRMLQGVRRIAFPYIGREFTAETVGSLQAAIDGLIVAERVNKIHQGAAVAISFSRADRIIGKMKFRLRLVPPFSIRQITVEMSLVADESEL